MGRGDEVKALLAAQRERRLAQVAALQGAFDAMVSASENSNADDEHDPEGATIAFERSQLAMQLAHAENALAEVDRALSRAQQGTYGSCDTCGQPISPDRMQARPTAVTCIACASRPEAGPGTGY